MVAPLVKQIWVVMGVLMNMFGQGMVLSFPSILLPAILAPDSEIQADMHVASWVASSIGLANIPGYLISSFLMGRYGRKIAHAVVIVPAIVGWFLIYIAPNVLLLLIGRFLCGIAGGATVTLSAIVIGEYTSPKYRGMFLILKTTAVTFGNMTVHILGHFLSWKYVALLALIPHIGAFFTVLTWPESPAWLASNKRFDLAERSFYWLRGTTTQSKTELEELIRVQKESMEYSMSMSEKVSDFLNKFTKKDFVKPLVVMIFAGILLEASGRHIFPAYALQIIGEVTGNDAHSFYYTVGIDIIISVSAVLSSLLVKIFKRRILLFGTGFSSLTVLACVCSYLYMSDQGIISKDKSWIPVSLFAVYFIICNLGCNPMPLVLLGEIFPLAHRGVGPTLSGFVISLSLMVAMKVTPYLLASVNVCGTFAVFGSAMGVTLGVLYFLVPETKERTLEEIEYYFNFGKFREDTNNKKDDEIKMKMIIRPNKAKVDVLLEHRGSLR